MEHGVRMIVYKSLRACDGYHVVVHSVQDQGGLAEIGHGLIGRRILKKRKPQGLLRFRSIVKHHDSVFLFPLGQLRFRQAGTKTLVKPKRRRQQNQPLDFFRMPCGEQRGQISTEARSHQNGRARADCCFNHLQLRGEGEPLEIAAVQLRRGKFDVRFRKAPGEEARFARLRAGGEAMKINDAHLSYIVTALYSNGMRISIFWLVVSSAALSAQVSVTMSQYDGARTNSNPRETILRPANVNAQQFGKLFAREVDEAVMAEPLILAGLDLGDGPRNILIVATMNNSVYAFDADRPEHGKPYWVRKLGVPAFGGDYVGSAGFGILSTPVFDPATGTIFAVSKNKDANGASTWLHALDVQTGNFKFQPVRLSYPFADGTTLTNVPDALQRAGLLVTGGTLVIATASILPREMQEGFVQAFDTRQPRTRLASFQVTPTGLKGGIWQAGRGVAADEDGHVYVATAGGTYDGKTNFGTSFLQMDAKTLALRDWFTPANYDYLYHNNVDPLIVTLLPHSRLMLGTGKEGVVYLIDRDKMGRLEAPGGGPVQRFQATLGCGKSRECAEAAQSVGTAYWDGGADGVLYIWDRNDTLRAYRFRERHFETAPQAVGPHAWVTGGPTVSSSGTDPGSGIVWAITGAGEPTPKLQGTLRAFAASDISRELYNSDTNAKRDAPGAFAKFATPVVANGKVYVPSLSNRVSVYGPLAQ